MRKAGNIMEIAMILGIVAVVTVGTLVIYNNQNLRLALLSAINFKPVNLSTMSQDTAKQIVPYNRVETAGGNALTNLGMTSSDFESALSHVSYGDLEDAFKDKEDGKKGIDSYANALNDLPELSKYGDLTETNITSQTLSDLVGILNTITDPGFLKAHPDQVANVNGFLERFSDILTAGTNNAKAEAASASESQSAAAIGGSGGAHGVFTPSSPGVNQGGIDVVGGNANPGPTTDNSGLGSGGGIVHNPSSNTPTGAQNDTTTTPPTNNTPTTGGITKPKPVVVVEDDDIIPAADPYDDAKPQYTVVKQKPTPKPKPRAADADFEVDYDAQPASSSQKNNTYNAIETSGIRAEDFKGGGIIQNVNFGGGP